MLTKNITKSIFSKFDKLPVVPKRYFLTVIQQYQRGIKLSFGQYKGTLEPGLRLAIPIYHNIIHVDVREFIEQLPKQSLISDDNVTFYVDASVQYKIEDPVKAILNVANIRKNI